MEDNLFRGRKKSDRVLFDFGFKSEEDRYVYSTPILEGQFELFVIVDAESNASTQLIDTDTDELYVLHLIGGSKGRFVSEVKAAYLEVLEVIDDLCFDHSVHKSHDASVLLDYIKKNYGNTIQFLWSKSSSNGVLRHDDVGKWYAAFLRVSKKSLGIEGEGSVELMNLKVLPETMESVLLHESILPGYHMNKKHWISIILGNHEDLSFALELLKTSYEITK